MIKHWMMMVGTCLWLSACFSVDSGETTAEGVEIPGQFPRLMSNEHVCELLPDAEPKAVEQRLDRYGHHGWKLAGFLTKNGETYAFCMVR